MIKEKKWKKEKMKINKKKKKKKKKKKVIHKMRIKATSYAIQ